MVDVFNNKSTAWICFKTHPPRGCVSKHIHRVDVFQRHPRGGCVSVTINGGCFSIKIHPRGGCLFIEKNISFYVPHVDVKIFKTRLSPNREQPAFCPPSALFLRADFCSALRRRISTRNQNFQAIILTF